MANISAKIERKAKRQMDKLSNWPWLVTAIPKKRIEHTNKKMQCPRNNRDILRRSVVNKIRNALVPAYKCNCPLIEIKNTKSAPW